MTVKEMITALEKVDGNATVIIQDADGDTYDVGDILCTTALVPENTPVVVIDFCY